MDYQARLDRIRELLCPGGAAGNGDAEAFVRACLDSGHRKHFFAIHTGGAVLRRRGKTIFDTIEAHKVVGDRAKPGKDQWQAFCESRDPLSLSAILKIDDALQAIADNDTEEVREVTIVLDEPYTLEAHCIVPSIYYARPADVLEYRVEKVTASDLPRQRDKLSQLIFGYQHPRTLEVLEKGDNNRHGRVTWPTVKKLASILGDEIEELFTYDPAAGPKNGEQTFALHPRSGNAMNPPIEPTQVVLQAAPAV